MTSPAQPLTQLPATHGRVAVLPAFAGVGYLAVWIAGLLAWPSNLALDATSAQIATAFRVHSAQAATQILLVEGLAGLPTLPRWLRTVAGLTALTLTVSGGAYLLLAGSASWTVYLSGPLLLLWITATGVWLRASSADRSPVNAPARTLRSPRSSRRPARTGR